MPLMLLFPRIMWLASLLPLDFKINVASSTFTLLEKSREACRMPPLMAQENVGCFAAVSHMPQQKRGKNATHTTQDARVS